MAPLRLNYKSGLLLARLTLGLVVLSCCSCAVSQQEQAQRFFWPPDPEYAKIEYIDFYETADDLDKSEPGLLSEFLGHEPPRPVFRYPYAVDTGDKGQLYITDSRNHAVVIFDFRGDKVSYLLDNDGLRYFFTLPLGIAVQADGRVLVADAKDHEILVFSPSGQFESVFGKKDLSHPVGIAYNAMLQRLYVVDTSRHQIVVFDKDNRKIAEIGKRGAQPGEFNFPLDLAIDPQGNLFVLDTLNARVQVFTAEGEFLRQFGERGTAAGSFALPKSIAVSRQGHVYVTDSLAHKFMVFSAEGEFLLAVGGRSSRVDHKLSPGGFYAPTGVVVSSSGQIFIADALNQMLHKFQYLTPEYLASKPILPGQTYFPLGMPGAR